MAELQFTDLLVNVVIIALSLIALNWASNLTLKNAVKIATATRIGKTSVGFSLIAFSTSLPELTVALIAAFSGGSALSVGNILGSNIVNICLTVGIATILLYWRAYRKLRKTTASKSKSNMDNVISSFAKSELSSIHFGLFISSIVPMILIYIRAATWIVGLILLFIFVGYMYKISKVRLPPENGVSVADDEKNRVKRYFALTVGGALGVVISAYFLVESAVVIATAAGISQQVIGATIIAFGTSLPELTLGLKSFLRDHPGLALGDIIGSSFVNTTLILGATFFVPWLVGTPISINMTVFQNLILFSIITNLFFWYFLSREKIGWKEGLIFIFIYGLFLATTLGFVQPTTS